MIVEDDPDIRETVLELLADNHLAAVGATDGAEALHLLHDPNVEKPDLILLDIMMPVMDGFAFRAAQQLAVDGFLRKPFDLDALLATVRRYCVAPSPP